MLLHNRLEGIGRYMHETLPLLIKARAGHQFVFLFDRPWHQQFVYASNIYPVFVPPQARHPLLFYAWFEWMIPRILRKKHADVFLSPDGYLSLRTAIPQIPVIHDLAFEHFPEGISRANRWHYQTYFPRYCQKAAHIATVSHFTKNDIVRTYGISPEKITVTGNAASAGFKPLEPAERELVRKKYSHGCPYFLYTGAIHPRKNIGNLLLAFDYFKERTPNRHKLLITGREAWSNESMKEIYQSMQYKHDVLFTGRLPDGELEQVMAAATGLCYVSLFEGFGIPILEAMQCGVPVITSTNSSMPEVAGDAALLVDALSPTAIAQAMSQVLDEKEKQLLVNAGLENASRYTWQAVADSLWMAIEQGLP